jgi:hypothetical protein
MTVDRERTAPAFCESASQIHTARTRIYAHTYRSLSFPYLEDVLVVLSSLIERERRTRQTQKSHLVPNFLLVPVLVLVRLRPTLLPSR